MAVKPLVFYPSNVLRTHCYRWAPTAFGRELAKSHAKDLRDTLSRISSGVALASPQIGVERASFAIRPDLLPAGIPDVLFDPHVVGIGETIQMTEGCLSIPGYQAFKTRYQEVTVTALDVEGASLEFKVSGLAAQAIQHEVDHLYGILIVDELPKEERHRIATDVTRLRQGKR